jgi:uncharacterized protein (TIGR02217 family)
MTLNLFPTSTHVSWAIEKAPNWATRMQRSVVGRELTVSDYVLPLYSITLTWEVLRDKWDTRMVGGRGTGHDELRQIWNFFNQQQGSAIPFAFFDQSDNTTRPPGAGATTFNFAVGDGVTTDFQMASPLLAPVVPVPGGIISASLNGVIQGGGTYFYNSTTDLLSFVSAPGNGVLIGSDFTFYYKVRFNTDGLSAENFAYQFWQMKQLKLLSKVY